MKKMPNSNQNQPEIKQAQVDKVIPLKTEIKPKTNSGMKLWYFGIGLLLLLNMVGIIFLMLNLPKKAKAIQQLRTQVLSSQMSGQDEKLLLQALEDTKVDREKLEAAFPNSAKNLINFINLIDEIKDNKQVEVVRFSVDSDKPTRIGRNPVFLPITLILKGKQSDVFEQLNTIINSPYFIRDVTYSQEFAPGSDLVIVQTAFHLFVADEFI